MENLKRKFQETCPDCNSQVELHQINFEHAIEICNNLTCAFPFNRPHAEGLIHEFPYSDVRYSKKLKTRSSTIANTVAVPTASDNDETSVKSAEETSSDIPESSSLIKQKDQLNYKGPTLSLQQGSQDLITQITDEDISKNITQAPPPAAKKPIQLPGNIALPPVTAAKQSSNTTSNVPDLSLEAIESLLNNNDINEIIPANISDCSSPSSITTPKDPSVLGWMEDMDALFGADMAQSKFNPLQVDNDFDSFLGI